MSTIHSPTLEHCSLILRHHHILVPMACFGVRRWLLLCLLIMTTGSLIALLLTQAQPAGTSHGRMRPIILGQLIGAMDKIIWGSKSLDKEDRQRLRKSHSKFFGQNQSAKCDLLPQMLCPVNGQIKHPLTACGGQFILGSPPSIPGICQHS